MFAGGVIIALAWMTSSTALYADYSGARMPYYLEDYPNRESISRNDYPERSPDASVSLDYKYEDASRGKYEDPTEKPAEENDAWQNNDSIMNDRRIGIEEDYIHDFEKFSDERSFKSNHRPDDRRLTIKRKKFNRDDSNQLYGSNRRRSQKNKLNRWDNSLNNGRVTDSSGKNGFGYGRGLKRSGRRKARDREDLITEPVFAADHEFDSEEINEKQHPLEALKRRRLGNGMSELDVNFIPHRDLGALADKYYPNYEEYYDMKRALNIKNNLLPNPPTKVSVSPMLTSGRPIDTWFRRANIPDLSIEPVVAKRPSLSVTKSTSTLATTISTSVMTSLKTSIVSTNTSELSLAEKSRISILKKAHRKENLNGGTVTTKPPVLMQVTERMQTVVMVEPPGSQLQRMQAREISDNSPERTARAKRLMRHKLLSNAKNIHELTDKWDEQVCDYIDVSLLNGTVRQTAQRQHRMAAVVHISVVLVGMVYRW